MLATNLLNPEEISNGEILEQYKLQQQPERGFRFIKNPEFLVKSIFLKSPRRIQALLMIMTLTLFIYNLGQYNLRQALQEKDESLPNQLKQATSKPTLRWVFELMQGISVITINAYAQETQRFIAKMSEIQKKIIDCFGMIAKAIYGLSEDTS